MGRARSIKELTLAQVEGEMAAKKCRACQTTIRRNA